MDNTTNTEFLLRRIAAAVTGKKVAKNSIDNHLKTIADSLEKNKPARSTDISSLKTSISNKASKESFDIDIVEGYGGRPSIENQETFYEAWDAYQNGNNVVLRIGPAGEEPILATVVGCGVDESEEYYDEGQAMYLCLGNGAPYDKLYMYWDEEEEEDEASNDGLVIRWRSSDNEYDGMVTYNTAGRIEVPADKNSIEIYAEYDEGDTSGLVINSIEIDDSGHNVEFNIGEEEGYWTVSWDGGFDFDESDTEIFHMTISTEEGDISLDLVMFGGGEAEE